MKINYTSNLFAFIRLISSFRDSSVVLLYTKAEENCDIFTFSWRGLIFLYSILFFSVVPLGLYKKDNYKTEKEKEPEKRR